MIEKISDYKQVSPFSGAPNAFFVTAKPAQLELNARLFKKQQTGHWYARDGRVKSGDALFLIMKSELSARDLFGGIVKRILPQEGGKKIIQVEKFIPLGAMTKRFTDFFGTTGSQGALSSAGFLSSWSSLDNRFQTDRVAQNDQSPADIDYSDSSQQRSILTRKGQPKFRARLLAAYGNKCAVTGCAVADVLEAAHIIPHSKQTDYRLSNGLLLRSDVHTLFDLGLLTVDEKFKVRIASSLKNSEFEIFAGKRLRLPKNVTDRPDPKKLSTRLKSVNIQ